MSYNNEDDIDKLKKELSEIESSLKDGTTSTKEEINEPASSQEREDSSDTQQIAQELSKSISRSLSNQKDIKKLEKDFHAEFAQLEDSLTSDFLEIGKSLSSNREKIKSLSSQLDTLENRIETKFQKFQATLDEQTSKSGRKNSFKSLQKSLQSLKTDLNKLKQETVAKTHLESLKRDIQQLRETVNNLKANLDDLNNRFVQKEKVQELKKLIQEEKERVNPFIEQLEEKELFLLNFPLGVSTLLIDKKSTISAVLEEIHERLNNKDNIPPKLSRTLRFNELRGVVTTYNGKPLQLHKDRKITEFFDSGGITTLQLKPYWYHEDFGGNLRVVINYSNGDKTIFTVPETTSMETISDEIEERILYIGEGLQATAKQHWEKNLVEGELGTVENLEFVVNGKLVEEMDTELLELQSFANETAIQVSFSYL